MGQRPRLDRSCWEIQRRGQRKRFLFWSSLRAAFPSRIWTGKGQLLTAVPWRILTRFTDVKQRMGPGYVLGIKIRKESLLDGLTVYGEDDHMEAVIQNDQDGGYDTVYELDGISVFLSGSSQNGVLNEVLYLQPEDLETPEELLNAFDLGYCHGAAGAAYVRDVLERQVRFTPPDTEAYLAVEVERDGELCTEYVPLTREEEREILDSKEPVPLEDGDRLEFFVSQETYEEQDIDGGAVTAPALRIAEERCGFRPSYIEPDMDIEKKEETREEAEKENEGEAGEETGEENEEAREEAGERAREAMENGEADGD